MVDKTCAKCGAKITANAKFCLGCGSPTTAEAPQAAQPTQTQQVPAPAGAGMQQPMGQTGSSGFDMLFSKAIVTGIFVVGLLISLIGRIIATFTWGDANSAGVSVNAVGTFLMGMFLVSGGLVNNSLDKYVRLGMILGGSFVIAMGL